MPRRPMIQVPVDESVSPKQRLDRFLGALLKVDKTDVKLETLKREKRQLEAAIAALEKAKRKKKTRTK